MKEKLQTKFATRQYMISDTFELYYYSTIDVPGVKEHTHTHYEFYLFLEGAISLKIDGVLYTPTPGDLLLIPRRAASSGDARPVCAAALCSGSAPLLQSSSAPVPPTTFT